MNLCYNKTMVKGVIPLDKMINIEIPEKMKTIIEIATGLTPENILEQIYYEILNDNKTYEKITVKEAAKIMGKSNQFVRMGLQQKTLPFGAAVKMSGEKFSYYISPKKFYEFVGKTKKDAMNGDDNNAH